MESEYSNIGFRRSFGVIIRVAIVYFLFRIPDVKLCRLVI